MDDHSDLAQALEYIDPSRLSYQEWVDVGMALHESGLPWTLWDEWSRRDRSRYHEGECERKFNGFGSGMGEHVKSGTVAAMARANGWAPHGEDRAIGWDDEVTLGPDPTWVEPAEITSTGKPPTTQLYEYIQALFDDDDWVGFVNESYWRDGRGIPANKGHKMKAGELLSMLTKTEKLDHVIGDWDRDIGAWIRFNPLDGNGYGNANVTEYRYALVESDSLPIEKQKPMIEAMNLPCAAIVSSGGKSVHAIVRVDAGDQYDLYRKRVERLYDYCRKHGFDPDTQNKNPSRLSRMPGVTRGEQTQELLAVAVGAESWQAWEDWVAESEDDLPEEQDSSDWDEPINLAPVLIGSEDESILRQRQKMIVVGDSKMGKSYTLIDLAEAICTGGYWIHYPCLRGKVFYVNCEIDPDEFKVRQHKVWEDRTSHGQDKHDVMFIKRNFYTWNLKGRVTLLEDLAPKLIRRVLKYGPPGTFAAIVLDPVYKLNGGDDNDPKMVTKFTNALDRIVRECGCSIIYAHHHPKGTAGQKKSMDRMAGSGVYARDADTVIDFTTLFMTSKDRKKMRIGNAPAYRMMFTCRSFQTPESKSVLFKFPRFYEDEALNKFKAEGEDVLNERQQKRKEAQEKAWKEKIVATLDAFKKCEKAGKLTTYKEVGPYVEGVDVPQAGLSAWFSKDGFMEALDMKNPLRVHDMTGGELGANHQCVIYDSRKYDSAEAYAADHGMELHVAKSASTDEQSG